jgi:hypothetical protein
VLAYTPLGLLTLRKIEGIGPKFCKSLIALVEERPVQVFRNTNIASVLPSMY